MSPPRLDEMPQEETLPAPTAPRGKKDIRVHQGSSKSYDAFPVELPSTEGSLNLCFKYTNAAEVQSSKASAGPPLLLVFWESRVEQSRAE